MGNIISKYTQTCGFGVLNNSNMKEINIGLSMAGTHYYENAVTTGEIFYRWPLAVHYTVYAFVRTPDGNNDITDGQNAREIAGSSLIGVITVGVAVATLGSMLAPTALALVPVAKAGIVAGYLAGSRGYAAYRTTEEVTRALKLGNAFSNGQPLYCEKKNCYGGGNGSWLVIEGGPYVDEDGYIRPQDLIIREESQEYIFRNGKFTKYSHDKFHSKEGLQCTKDCTICPAVIDHDSDSYVDLAGMEPTS